MQKTLVVALFLLVHLMLMLKSKCFGNAQLLYQQVSPNTSNGAMNVTACTYADPGGDKHAAISFDLSDRKNIASAAYVRRIPKLTPQEKKKLRAGLEPIWNGVKGT